MLYRSLYVFTITSVIENIILAFINLRPEQVFSSYLVRLIHYTITRTSVNKEE